MKILTPKLSTTIIQEVQQMGPEELDQLNLLIDYQWTALDKRAKEAVRSHFYKSFDFDFHYKGKHYQGAIEKINPKFANLKTSDGSRFKFSYSLLAEILNLQLSSS